MTTCLTHAQAMSGGQAVDYVYRQYDMNNQVTKMAPVRATNDYGLTKTTSRAIDAYGRTVTKTLGNGVTTAYQYDDSGALTRIELRGR